MAPQEQVSRDEFVALEERVTQLEGVARVESGLRAMTDLDQATLRARLDAQDRLLRALSETQSDHTARLTRLEAGQEQLEAGQQQLVAGYQQLVAGQQVLEARSLELERVVGNVQQGVQTILELLSNGR